MENKSEIWIKVPVLFRRNQNILCLILTRYLPYIYMQFKIVGYLPLVDAMFRYAESHIFSHHSILGHLKSINQRLFLHHLNTGIWKAFLVI